MDALTRIATKSSERWRCSDVRENGDAGLRRGPRRIDALTRIATRGTKEKANGCSDVRENVDRWHHGAASLR